MLGFTFLVGVGIGGAITDAINRWRDEEDGNKQSDVQGNA